MFTCFSCGNNKMKEKPFALQPSNAIANLKSPPWPKHWGSASGETCAYCGFAYVGAEGVDPSLFMSHIEAWAEATKEKTELINQLKAVNLCIPKSLYSPKDPNLDLYKCLVCGYPGMDAPQFASIPMSPHPIRVDPPFQDHWGFPSYDVCPCCAYEAGNDDSFSKDDPNFAKDFLVQWYADGANWLVSGLKPENWDLIKQLKKAGICIPEEIRISRAILGKVE